MEERMRKKDAFLLMSVAVVLILSSILYSNCRLWIVNRYDIRNGFHIVRYDNQIYYIDTREKSGVYRKTEDGNAELVYSILGATSIAVNEKYIYISTTDGIVQITHDGKKAAENTQLHDAYGMYADSKYLYLSGAHFQEEEGSIPYIMNGSNIE